MSATENTIVIKDTEGRDAVLSLAAVMALVSEKASKADADAAVKLAKQVEASTAQIADLTVKLTAQGDTIKSLSEKNAELELARRTDAAQAQVAALISDGRVMPKQREHYVKLALSNQELFQSITADLPKIVNLSGNERGSSDTVTSADSAEAKMELAIKSQIAANPK